MAWVKKWPQLFVRELSREVFPGETVDFFRRVRAFSTTCFEQLARTLINSRRNRNWLAITPREARFFAPRPGQKPGTAFLAKLGEIVNVGSDGGCQSAAPLPAARCQGNPIALMTAAGLGELRSEHQEKRTFIIS